jgi:hypothetical protein
MAPILPHQGRKQTAEDRQRLYYARDLAVMHGNLSELAAIIRANLGI